MDQKHTSTQMYLHQQKRWSHAHLPKDLNLLNWQECLNLKNCIAQPLQFLQHVNGHLRSSNTETRNKFGHQLDLAGQYPESFEIPQRNKRLLEGEKKFDTYTPWSISAAFVRSIEERLCWRNTMIVRSMRFVCGSKTSSSPAKLAAPPINIYTFAQTAKCGSTFCISTPRRIPVAVTNAMDPERQRGYVVPIRASFFAYGLLNCSLLSTPSNSTPSRQLSPNFNWVFSRSQKLRQIQTGRESRM